MNILFTSIIAVLVIAVVSTTPCKTTGSRCITSCANEANGDYQSCRGCDIYASCVAGRMIDNRPCARSTVWDDAIKICKYRSSTCVCQDQTTIIPTTSTTSTTTSPEELQVRVNGEWGIWGPYGACSVSCGLGGEKVRQRQCDSPAPEGGGLPCSGDDTDLVSCNEDYTCPDCTKTCAIGTLNFLCTLCECETTIRGTVKVGPLGLADVQIRAVGQEWANIALTNSQGVFEILGYCSDGLELIAVKSGYGTPEYSYVVTDALAEISMNKLKRPTITSSPSTQVAYEGDIVTLSCSAIDMTNIEWFLNEDFLKIGQQDDAGTSKLEVVVAGDYKCRAISKVGKTFSTTAVVTFISAEVKDSCSEVRSNRLTLEQSCHYTDSNNVITDVIDIGTCGIEACVSTDTDSISDRCCVGVQHELLEIKCLGFSYQQVKITECGCAACSSIKDVYIIGMLVGKGFDGRKDYEITVPDYNGPLIKVQENGKFTFVSEFKENIVFWVSAENIVKQLVTINPLPDVDEYFTEVTVVLKPEPQTISASQNSSTVQIISPDGLSNVASLTFPQFSFQYRDGRQYIGDVKVYASFADPRDRQSILSATAQFSFVDDEGISRLLETFGVATVTATSDAGEPLVITGRLLMSVNATALGITSITGPSAALLWTVDLASGGWQEYGHFDLEHTPHRRRKRSNHQIEIVDGYIVLPAGSQSVNIDTFSRNQICFLSVQVTSDPLFTIPLSGIKIHALAMSGGQFVTSESWYTNSLGNSCIRVLCNVISQVIIAGNVVVHPTHTLPSGYGFSNLNNGVSLTAIAPTTPAQEIDGPIFRNWNNCMSRTYFFQFGKPASSMKPLKSGNQGILNVVQRSMEAPMSWRPVDKPLFTMCAVSLLIHTYDKDLRVMGISRNQAGSLYGSYTADLKLAWPQAEADYVSCVLVRCPDNNRTTSLNMQIVGSGRKHCRIISLSNTNPVGENQATVERLGSSNVSQNLTISDVSPTTISGSVFHIASENSLKSATMSVLSQCAQNYHNSIAYYVCLDNPR